MSRSCSCTSVQKELSYPRRVESGRSDSVSPPRAAKKKGCKNHLNQRKKNSLRQVLSDPGPQNHRQRCDNPFLTVSVRWSEDVFTCPDGGSFFFVYTLLCKSHALLRVNSNFASITSLWPAEMELSFFFYVSLVASPVPLLLLDLLATWSPRASMRRLLARLSDSAARASLGSCDALAPLWLAESCFVCVPTRPCGWVCSLTLLLAMLFMPAVGDALLVLFLSTCCAW